ncbi:MAG TPA: hypothetical protein VMW15_10965, partial [Terracidiphilus sp.]|nr:hypothetical protein [Terracidiphilus sp.]
GLQQGSKELESQLQQTSIHNQQLSAQADEQAQAHRSAIEQLEQRIHQMDAEHDANLVDLNQQKIELEQRSRELEQQLQQVTLHGENEMALARQAALEQAAAAEQLAQRQHGLEAEKDAANSQLKTLQARVAELQDQLQQAAARATTAEAPRSEVPAVPSAQLLRHAEWIMGRAVGPVLPYGLVAAEAYAAAALAANPQGADAPQLLAELARIRRAFPQGLPSVSEAITTFDEKAAAFFDADPARAAEIAEEEAQRRYRAGLNRSALMAANTALELRQKDRP